MTFKPDHFYLIQTTNLYNFAHLNDIVFCFIGYISQYDNDDFIYGKLPDNRPLQFLANNPDLLFIEVPKAAYYLYS